MPKASEQNQTKTKEQRGEKTHKCRYFGRSIDSKVDSGNIFSDPLSTDQRHERRRRKGKHTRLTEKERQEEGCRQPQSYVG